MAKLRFTSLHHHSTFSFGDGFGTPVQHVTRAAELGYSAMALTEHGNVSSHFQFEKAAVKAGVKPIFGLEAYCGPVDEQTRSQWKYHLTILASDVEGYRNLNRIVTQSYRDFHYHPTVSGASLAASRSGLCILSGCAGSLLACTTVGGKGIAAGSRSRGLKAARAVIERFVDTFGDRYFLEVQPFWELDNTEAINTAYARLSQETGVPLVVTQDVHYPRPEQSEMQAILHAVHRGKHSVDDAMREWNYEVPMTLPESDKALADRLIKTGLSRSEAYASIEMSGIIGDMCNVTLPKAEPLRYPVTDADLIPWT